MSKKKTKSLLPKRIAGVKVPKSVRKGRLGQLLASKAGQALLAEAVMAAGAVAAGKKAKDSPKVRSFASYAADRVQQVAEHRGKDMGAAGSALAMALGEAARSFVDALNRHEDAPAPLHATDGDDRVWTASDEEDASKKSRSRTRRARSRLPSRLPSPGAPDAGVAADPGRQARRGQHSGLGSHRPMARSKAAATRPGGRLIRSGLSRLHSDQSDPAALIFGGSPDPRLNFQCAERVDLTSAARIFRARIDLRSRRRGTPAFLRSSEDTAGHRSYRN